MNTIVTLTKRNLKIFLRDKMTIFFTFISSFIMVMVYFFFIAKVYTSGMDDPEMLEIPMYLSLSLNAKNFIVYMHMIAGILTINSMTLATGAFSTIAKDFEQGRVDNFLLTPIKTHEIIAAYFATGFITSYIINTLTWLLSFIVIGITTGYWLTVGTFFAVFFVIFILSLISCATMLLITSLVKSSVAIGVFNGISGTALGFLCGIYLPYSTLTEITKAVGSLLPFTHFTIWLKQIVFNDAFSLTGISGELRDFFMRDYFSAESVGFLSFNVPLYIMIIFSCFLGLLCLSASYFLLRRRIKGQRK